MTQSRHMSLTETITNLAIGHKLAVVTQIIVFPWFGLYPILGQNLPLGGIFTVFSLIGWLRPAQAVRGHRRALR